MTSVAIRRRSSRASARGAGGRGEGPVGDAAGIDGPAGVAAAPSLVSMGRSRGSPARKMTTAKTMPAAAIQNDRL